MKRTRIKTWIKALRSGKFQQTDGQLCRRPTADPLDTRDPRHCCLGVYEELCREKPLSEKLGCQGGNSMQVADFLSEQGVCDVMQGELADMNDNGKTFEEIAGFIERTIS